MASRTLTCGTPMRLLITTQVADTEDPDLGFFVRWIEEFAMHCEQIEVICLFEGKHKLPANVRIHSLGKERGSRSSFSYAASFLVLLWQLRGRYDAVFVHMNPEYIILGAPFWKLARKRVALWYLHKRVDLKLRIAALLADVILTASKESFRLDTPNLRIVGHGIVTEDVVRIPRESDAPLRILTAGRITPAKGVLEMLESIDRLTARGVSSSFRILGAPATTNDHAYSTLVDARIQALPKGTVERAGAVPHRQIPGELAQADIFLNLSETGSVDKAILEALASGVPVVTSNEAFKDLLTPYGLYVDRNDPEKIADALTRAPSIDVASLTLWVKEHHALTSLVPRIIATLAP